MVEPFLSVLPEKYLAALIRTAVAETCADYKGAATPKST
jgi:hypothetical protein